MQEIQDSEDDSLHSSSPLKSSSPIKQIKSTFSGVVIKQTTTRYTKAMDSQTASSVADSMEISDYETPATSTVPTPADTTKSARRGRPPKAAITARALEIRSSVQKLSTSRASSTKRKIKEVVDSDDDLEARDFKLARKLQQEEYGDSEALSSLDSMSETPDMSEEVTDSEDDDVPLATTRSRRLVSSARRGRAAPVLPSESSDLSELGSDFEETDFDGTSTTVSSAAVADEDGTENAGSSHNAQAALSASRARFRDRIARRRNQQQEIGNRRAQRERKKLEKSHPEIITMWDTLKAVDLIKPTPAEQPDSINRKLKTFQLEGLNWMIRQEQSQWKGGLLGDEMGMGKTIQAVSLIMSDFPAKQPTLVVVPPVALMQWQSEINDYTMGKLKVLIYHVSANPKCKLMTTKDLLKYNVIMVSYSGLESMYRKENKGWNRNDGIVKEDSILHSIKYHRLILDEAHSIKQRTTSVAKACFAMKADYKWCLSGTPVQNRIGEFFSLLRFLEVVPFACYFCKECACKELHWSQNESRMCTKCNHSGFNHVSVFNQEILNPITQGEDPSLRKRALEKLRLITDRIMLRRMKRDYTSSMELPPKDVIIHNEFFGEIERDFSQSIMSNSTRKFDTYVHQGVMLNNYANIFGLIMQMRQVANHPDLILKKNAEGGQNVLICSICDEPAEEAIRSRCHHEFCRECVRSYVRSFDGQGGEADCPRCHIPLSIDWEQPEIEQDEENVKKSSIINRIKMEDWTSSTKIEMLVYDLYKLRSKKQTHKSIVFSQFTSMLQLVQWRLQKSGFSTVLLDGSMSPAQRQKSIDYFMTNVDVEVFLVSLKAGGVALNLTEASRVFIVDPYVYPFHVEMQLLTDTDGGILQPNGRVPIVAIVLDNADLVSSHGFASRTQSSHVWFCSKRRRPT